MFIASSPSSLFSLVRVLFFLYFKVSYSVIQNAQIQVESHYPNSIRLSSKIIKIKKNQLHAESRTQQSRHIKPNGNTPLFSEFCRHCVLSGETQRHASTPERRNGNIHIYIIFHFLEWGSNPQSVAYTVKITSQVVDTKYYRSLISVSWI